MMEATGAYGMVYFLFAAVAVAAGAVAALLRHHDPAARGRALRRGGLGLTIVFTVLASLFIGGETFSDPGGWAAVGLVALWFVPMAILAAFAWRKPERALPLLGGLTALVVAASVWYAADSHAWRHFENAHGPVRAIAGFALSAALAALGFHRPRVGGLLLLVGAGGPVVLSMLATGGLHMASFVALSAPALLTAVLYLWAVAVEAGATDGDGGATPAHGGRTGRRR